MKNRARLYINNFILALHTLIVTILGCVIYGVGEGTIDVFNLPYPLMKTLVVIGIVVLAMPVVVTLYRNLVLWRKLEIKGVIPVVLVVLLNLVPYIMIYAGARLLA